jgi:hypothetical protein
VENISSQSSADTGQCIVDLIIRSGDTRTLVYLLAGVTPGGLDHVSVSPLQPVEAKGGNTPPDRSTMVSERPPVLTKPQSSKRHSDSVAFHRGVLERRRTPRPAQT